MFCRLAHDLIKKDHRPEAAGTNADYAPDSMDDTAWSQQNMRSLSLR
jgi:hypothetical protein